MFIIRTRQNYQSSYLTLGKKEENCQTLLWLLSFYKVPHLFFSLKCENVLLFTPSSFWLLINEKVEKKKNYLLFLNIPTIHCQFNKYWWITLINFRPKLFQMSKHFNSTLLPVQTVVNGLVTCSRSQMQISRSDSNPKWEYSTACSVVSMTTTQLLSLCLLKRWKWMPPDWKQADANAWRISNRK